MPRFKIPVSDGQSMSSANQQIDPADRFGNQVEKVIDPVMPTSDAFGGIEAQALSNAGGAVDRVNSAITNMVNREERLRQSEEKNKATLALTDLKQEKQNAENDLREQAYNERWSADTFKEKLSVRVKERADALADEEYNTYIGDRFRASLDSTVKGYDAEWQTPGSIVEKYRTDKILEHTNSTIEKLRQTAAANGTYEMVMDNAQELQRIFADPTNVVAMGGAAAADKKFIETLNEHYVDHIVLTTRRNPELALNLLSTNTDEDTFTYYAGLDPLKRNNLIVQAGDEFRRRVKAGRDQSMASAMLEHVERTGNIPFNDPQYKKNVNDQYREFSNLASLLPTDQRYATSREFIKMYQIIPSDLKGEIVNTFGSQDPLEVQSVARYVSTLIDDNQTIASELPDEIVNAAVLVKAGTSPERLAEVIGLGRNMTVTQKETYKAQWKDQEYDDHLDSYASSMAKDISGNWFSTPSTDGDFNGQAARLIKAYFPLTGGNIEAAKELARLDMQKTWAVTEIDGSERMMQFAPEAVVPMGTYGNWMKSQLQSEIYEETGIKLDDEKFRLVPTAATYHGKDPAYMIMSQDENGMYSPITDVQNGIVKWRPDYLETPEYREEQRELIEKETKAYEDNVNAKLLREYKVRFRTKYTAEFIKKRNAEINDLKIRVQYLKSSGEADNTAKIARLESKLKEWEAEKQPPDKVEIKPSKELAEYLNLKWVEAADDGTTLLDGIF